jgi:tellurite methyltransferase
MDTDWPRYYEITAQRPSWHTTTSAADAFGPVEQRRLVAVDLGCGAGRDSRELLRRGWDVIAVDQEQAAIETARSALSTDERQRFRGVVADLGSYVIPPCDLVVANLVLPFLAGPQYAGAWARIGQALSPGGRVAAMVFSDRDSWAAEPGMTCPAPDQVRGFLDGFDIEHWDEVEEDRPTALGEEHHWHRIDLVARRS